MNAGVLCVCVGGGGGGWGRVVKGRRGKAMGILSVAVL